MSHNSSFNRKKMQHLKFSYFLTVLLFIEIIIRTEKWMLLCSDSKSFRGWGLFLGGFKH